MKTGQYYFDKLSEVEQQEFKSEINSSTRHLALMLSRYPYTGVFFWSSFDLEKSRKGFKYWKTISDRIY